MFSRRNILKGGLAAFGAAIFHVYKAGADTGVSTHTIEIRDFEFVPANLAVKPGDTIIWTNRDFAPHTATADDGSWDTDKLEQDESFSMIVTDKTFKDYFCRFHPHMKAQLTIKK